MEGQPFMQVINCLMLTYNPLKEGILSISELAGDPDKMTIDEIRNIIEIHKFKFCINFSFLFYTLIFWFFPSLPDSQSALILIQV